MRKIVGLAALLATLAVAAIAETLLLRVPTQQAPLPDAALLWGGPGAVLLAAGETRSLNLTLQASGGLRVADAAVSVATSDPELLSASVAGTGGAWTLTIVMRDPYGGAAPPPGVVRTAQISVTARINATASSLPVLVTLADDRPDVPEFQTVADATGDRDTLSAEIVAQGFTRPVAVTALSGPGAPVLLVNGLERGLGATVSPGDRLRLRARSGPEDGAARVITFAYGGVAGTWTLIAPDVTPDIPTFAQTSGHPAGEVAESTLVTVTGVTGRTYVEARTLAGDPRAALPGFDINPQVSINDGPYATFGWVGPGGTLRLAQRLPPGATSADRYRIGLTLGAFDGRSGVETGWEAVPAGIDARPEQFYFNNNVATAAASLAPIAVAGADPEADIASPSIGFLGFDAETRLEVGCVSGCMSVQLSLDGRAPTPATLSQPSVVRPGQTIQLYVRAPTNFTQVATVSVRVGDLATGQVLAGSWTVATRAQDSVPLNHVVPNIAAPQAYRALAESAVITPSDYGEPLTVRVAIPAGQSDAGMNPAPDAEVRIAGGAWTRPDAAGVAGTLQRGQTLQIRRLIALADGFPKAVTVTVGDAAPYTWTVQTLDQFPSNTTTFGNVTNWNTSQPGWLPQQILIAGLGAGVGAPLSGSAGFLTYPAANRLTAAFNGDNIGTYVGASSQPNTTVTYNFDIGGYKFSNTVTSNNVPSPPRWNRFRDINDAAANTRACSPWSRPYAYGAPITASITAGPTSGTDSNGNARIEKRTHLGNNVYSATSIATSHTLASDFNDEVRLCVGMGSNQLVQVTTLFTGMAATVWSARTAAAPRDTVPDAAVRFGTNSDTIDYNVTQWTPGAVRLTGFTGPLEVCATQIGGPTDSVYRLELHNIYYYNEGLCILLSEGEDFRFANYPPRTPGAVYTYSVRAGTYNPPTIVTLTVRAVDEEPDPVDFVDIVGAAGTAEVRSAIVSPTGFAAPIAVAITGDGAPRLSIAGGAPVTSGTLAPGQTLQLLQTTGPETGAALNATVTLTGRTTGALQTPFVRSDTWRVTTRDTQPDPISFAAEVEAEPGTWVRSPEVTIGGLPTGATFSITGTGNPRLEKSGSGSRVTSGTLATGDRIVLWNQLGTGFGQPYDATLALGSTPPVTWRVTTRAEDRTPTLALRDVGGAQARVVVTSDRFFPADYRDPAPFRLTDPSGTGLVDLNGAGYVPIAALSPAATIAPGQWFRLRLTSGPPDGSARAIGVDVNGVIDSWDVTTEDAIPDVPAFPTISAAPGAGERASATVTLGGFATPVALRLARGAGTPEAAGGRVLVNGTTEIAAGGQGVVSAGQTLQLFLGAPAAAGATHRLEVTLGTGADAVTANWDVMAP